MSVQVFGARDLTKALETLGKEVVGKGARGPVAKATRKTIVPVQRDAIAGAPEGKKGVTSDDPGRLKRNIKLRRIKDAHQYGLRNGEIYEVYVRASRNKKPDDKNNAWYWHFVEFGTSKQSPQQFLRPALDAHRSSFPADWTRNFMRDFDKVVKELERKSRSDPSR